MVGCSRSGVGCAMMGVMQGSAVMDRELLDAEAVCGHLLAEGFGACVVGAASDPVVS